MTILDLDRNDVAAAVAWAKEHAPLRPKELRLLQRLQDDPADRHV